MIMFTCPFCFHRYYKSKVLYRCPVCEEDSKPGFLEREPIKCKKDSCEGLATRRVCPHCGNTIPKTALETPNLPFSIVGVSTSGKTNYITVMLHELGRSPGLRLALGHQTEKTLTHQKQNYEQIYERHIPIESTKVGQDEPQIWFIRNLQKRHGNNVPTYTFTIFDGVGEKHESLDPTSTDCRYINASKAIILTIDPLVLPSIRRGGVVDSTVRYHSLGLSRDGAKTKEEKKRDQDKDSKEIVNTVATYIKTARGIKSSKMLDIPVAVVLTKFDTVLNHPAFGPQALIKNSSLTVRDGTVDLAEIQQVHAEISNWLEQIGESAFIDALASHFKEFYFFGVSSFGAPPKTETTLPDEIRPHRVLDPIFWLFKRANFID